MEIKFNGNFKGSFLHCVAAITAAALSAALMIFLCYTLTHLPAPSEDSVSSDIINAIDAEKDKVASENAESVVSE